MSDFGKILKSYRAASHESQSEVASRLGISRNYLSQIERGKARNISFKLASRILNLNSSHGCIRATLVRHVWLDAQIATEVVWLNQQGVITESSCQGPPPTALIRPSSVEGATRLGYKPVYQESGLYEIALKSQDR